MVTSPSDTRFINFLQNDLALSTGDIAVVLRKQELDKGPLAMLLWQYGLVDIEQLEQILDWLEDQA
jgi:energy-converting hydrogenase Eha subunit C